MRVPPIFSANLAEQSSNLTYPSFKTKVITGDDDGDEGGDDDGGYDDDDGDDEDSDDGDDEDSDDDCIEYDDEHQ